MKHKILTGILLLCSCYAQAQFDEPMKAFPSPGAASFGIYGKIPVNGFTGAPDISIPLYDFKIRGVSVPVNLSYHTASVKPNMHPGWVGLGWNLLAGGCITRKVNCMPDELADSDGTKHGYFGHYADLDSDDWTSDEKMSGYQTALTGLNIHEAIPDEFNFNFCGYSGTFYLDHKGGWQVRSDVDIKVVFNEKTDYLSILKVRKNLQDGIKRYGALANNARLINGFTLITPDGSQYVFGGNDATEYTIPYFFQSSGYLVATSWFLTEIVLPQGFKVNLTYEPGEPIIEMKPFYTMLSDGQGHTSGCLDKYNENSRECILMFPVYLKKIQVDDIGRTVEFTSSNRYDLKLSRSEYTSNQLLNLIKKTTVLANLHNLFYMIDEVTDRAVFVNGRENVLNWRKLDRIIIKDGSVQKNIDFVYSYPVSTQRMQLDSLKIPGQGDYLFSYYDTHRWPDYHTDEEDFWGYYNAGGELSAVDAESFSEHRLPSYDLDVRIAHVLSEITYPSGGKTKFVYDKNYYSSYINNMNELEQSGTLSTGGIRIKRIVRFKPDQTEDGSLSYFYLKDFNSLADTAKSKSSGILAKYPYLTSSFKMKMIFKEEKKGDIVEDHDFTLFSSGAMSPYSSNTNGSHIGYSDVIELARDGKGQITGYKKLNFSNFDTDLWGESHFDELFICGSHYNDYLLNHLTDKSQERGKKMSEEYYGPSGDILRKVLYKYTQTPEKDYIRSLSFLKFCLGYFRGIYVYFNAVDAYKTYTYNYNLAGKQEYVYGVGGSSKYTKTDDTYTYNSLNLLTEESHSAPGGNRIVTSYKYPCDLPDNPVASDFVELHYQVPLQKRTVLNKPDGSSLFLTKELFDYELNMSIPYLCSYKKAMKNESDLVEYFKCDAVDDRGNSLHVVHEDKSETVYYWSADCYTPTVEMQNASVQDCWDGFLDCENIEGLQQKFPQSRISVFKFTYDGKKIWNKDVRGLELYYKYNASGWLRAIYDHDFNLLKQYDYEYRIK